MFYQHVSKPYLPNHGLKTKQKGHWTHIKSTLTSFHRYEKQNQDTVNPTMEDHIRYQTWSSRQAVFKQFVWRLKYKDLRTLGS